MPRIPEVPDPPGDAIAREVFDKQREDYGQVLNTARVYAHRPTILRAAAQLSEGVRASGLLDGALRALVNVRVASHNGCPF